jgi:hypothetical protein
MHTSAYVSIRQHTSVASASALGLASLPPPPDASVCIRQHTSAYVSIRQHTSAYVRRLACSLASLPPPPDAPVCVLLCE